jgi:transposase
VTHVCKLFRRSRSAKDNDPSAGTVDGCQFKQYIQQILVPVLGNYWAGEPPSNVVMDNAPTQISKQVYDLIEATGAQLIYFPEYSPDFNPKEFCFRQYKAHLRRNTGKFGTSYYRRIRSSYSFPLL